MSHKQNLHVLINLVVLENHECEYFCNVTLQGKMQVLFNLSGVTRKQLNCQQCTNMETKNTPRFITKSTVYYVGQDKCATLDFTTVFTTALIAKLLMCMVDTSKSTQINIPVPNTYIHLQHTISNPCTKQDNNYDFPITLTLYKSLKPQCPTTTRSPAESTCFLSALP